jgi:hypothetical protein
MDAFSIVSQYRNPVVCIKNFELEKGKKQLLKQTEIKAKKKAIICHFLSSNYC